MPKENPFIRHFIISLSVFVVLLCVVVFSFTLIQKILVDPQKYFNTDLSPVETQFVVVYISLIIISVLIAYILYLILASRTRAELIARSITKSLVISREQFEGIYEGAPVPYITLDKKACIPQSKQGGFALFRSSFRRN